MSERIGHGDGVELTNISEECTLCGADVISMIANEGFVSQTTGPIFRTQVYEVFPPRLRGASFSVTIEVSVACSVSSELLEVALPERLCESTILPNDLVRETRLVRLTYIQASGPQETLALYEIKDRNGIQAPCESLLVILSEAFAIFFVPVR